MDEASPQGCARCGATPAELFANDGLPVCDACFAYDQITSGELRASQLTLRVAQDGSAEAFLHRVLRRGRGELAYSLVLGAISLALLHYGRHEDLALACGIVTTALTFVSTLHAIGTLRYAREEAPRVYHRVSSHPPPRHAVPPGPLLATEHTGPAL